MEVSVGEEKFFGGRPEDAGQRKTRESEEGSLGVSGSALIFYGKMEVEGKNVRKRCRSGEHS